MLIVQKGMYSQSSVQTSDTCTGSGMIEMSGTPSDLSQDHTPRSPRLIWTQVGGQRGGYALHSTVYHCYCTQLSATRHAVLALFGHRLADSAAAMRYTLPYIIVTARNSPPHATQSSPYLDTGWRTARRLCATLYRVSLLLHATLRHTPRSPRLIWTQVADSAAWHSTISLLLHATLRHTPRSPRLIWTRLADSAAAMRYTLLYIIVTARNSPPHATQSSPYLDTGWRTARRLCATLYRISLLLHATLRHTPRSPRLIWTQVGGQRGGYALHLRYIADEPPPHATQSSPYLDTGWRTARGYALHSTVYHCYCTQLSATRHAVLALFGHRLADMLIYGWNI
ncbi:hypothetical protein J6590_006498 [Homalodisca vitripennis]|nr:hypothetical protein J6590_006498 [Homalodisca vitripennis]